MQVDKAVVQLSKLLVPNDTQVDHRRNVEAALYNFVGAIKQAVHRDMEEYVEGQFNAHKLYDSHGD